MRRDICFGAKAVPQMNWGRSHPERPHQHFRGSLLVSTLLEQFPYRFRSRASAVRFSKRLFREGKIQSTFHFPTFEDSEQLYAWQNDDKTRTYQNMTSSRRDRPQSGQGIQSSGDVEDSKIIDTVKSKLSEKTPNVSLINNFFEEFEEDFPEARLKSLNSTSSKTDHYHVPWTNQRGSTASSESSADTATVTQSYPRYRDKYSNNSKGIYNSIQMATQGRDHEVIHEEDVGIERAEGNSLEIELESNMARTLSSHVTGISDLGETSSQRRWQDSHYSYSDNEKQLIEEMKRMKKEHQHITKSYEERINKLMAKMHELRSIAEMLENTSAKSSPYGILPVAKSNLLNAIGAKLEQERKQAVATFGIDVPPPLPPRPGRGNKVYPNKPIVHPRLKMKHLQWSRIILREEGCENSTSSIWQSMLEPKIDTDELERLYQMLDSSKADVISLYDDIMHRRGQPKQQYVNVYEGEKCRRIIYTMKSLPCSLPDILSSFTTLDTSSINSDRFAELLELFGSGNEMEKILQHARRKGTDNLDSPEFLLIELTKVEGFKDKLEFTRFRYRVQWHLFEIEQQLRELHTACDEITNSIALKNLLETLLAVGNYLNGGSENGQADGFNLDILNKLKEIQDWDGKGNLLEFILKLYCQFYEPEIDIGCPTRFRLPEPSNMRHAAQVSLDSVQDVLSNLQSDVQNRRDKLLGLSKGDNQPLDSYKTKADNFFTSVIEMISEEEKLLHDTRDVFHRTKGYFLYDNKECKPQQFFQLWATFLHDCKYYWKLAHRKIAKERFEQELKYKGQTSSNSLHGYETFRASMLRRLTALRGVPDPTLTHTHSVKQINKWIDSVEELAKDTPSVPPLPQKDTKSAKLEAEYQHRSGSPKPLTSEPPSTGILHKPLPKTPMTNGVVNHLKPESHGDYENQDDIEKSTIGSRDDLSHLKEIDSSKPSMSLASPNTSTQQRKPEKQSQFFLKSLLKRDPAKRNNSGESRTSSESHVTEQENMRRHSNNTFSKLRHSVVQKFSGSGAKRSPQNLQSPLKEELLTPQMEAPSFMPLTLTDSDVINPYETSYGRENRVPGRIQTNGDTQESHSDRYNASNERRYKHEASYFSPRTPGKSRNDSDISTEYAALYHTPPFGNAITTVDKDGYASPNVITPYPKSDINNNEKRTDYRDRHGASRQRAPIALGSNISISDAYNREVTERTPNRYYPPSSEYHPPSEHTTDHLLSSTDKNTRHTGNPVPTYKAKIVHNYENQGKLEPARAIKQQAEPVLHSHKINGPSHVRGEMNGQSHVRGETHDRYGDYTSDDSTEVKYPFDSQNKFGDNTSLKSTNQNPHRNIPSDRTHEKQFYSSQYTPETLEKQTISSRTPALNQAVPQKQFTPNKRMSDQNKDNVRFALSRVPASTNNQTISNLIERFEKKQQHSDHSVNEFSENKNLNQNKSMAATSTPVTPRRPIHLPLDESDDPPPIPPRTDHTPESRPYPSMETSNIPGSMSTNQSDPRMTTHHDHRVTTQPDQRATTQSDQRGVTPRGRFSKQVNPGVPPPKPPHTRDFSNASSNDDSYKDSLRKAATSSVFDRYKMSPMSPSTPNYSRQSSQNSQIQQNLHPLSRHDNVNLTPNTTNPSSYNPNQQYRSQERGQQNTPQYTRQGQGRSNQGHGQGSTAVVKPTILHQGNITFMEF